MTMTVSSPGRPSASCPPVSPPPVTVFGEPVIRADTVADRADFLTAGFTPVACRTCGVAVLVRKNSREQTSIQWTSSGADCEFFSAERSAGRSPALTPTCPRLMESINRAAKVGAVPISGVEQQ